METILGLDLPTWWFLVIGGLITGYGVLDGFDLGAGALHLFFKKEESRRLVLNAIGPVWDGNEVWLVIAGGALFAGFPLVYGVVLSTFYVPFMLFLVALIFRAISIEFRSKKHGYGGGRCGISATPFPAPALRYYLDWCWAISYMDCP